LLASLQSSNAQLSDAVESRRKALSTIETETSQLMAQTRQGRADSEEVNKRAKTLGYQVERLQEGTDELKATLDGYTKRTNDARNLAIGAGYVLEKFEEDANNNSQ
jgi:uncharacterized caspase-like protein